jgi:hypothetical protein
MLMVWVYLDSFSCQFMGSFVCGSISFPRSDCGVGLHLRGNALGRSGSDDYVSGGDVAIGLIPDLLSRGTAIVLRVLVVIPTLDRMWGWVFLM